ncbi:MAG: ABC transporter ATP-binding protein, partial [Eubacterium sp.]
FLFIIGAQALLQVYCRHRQAVIQGRLEMRFKLRGLGAMLKKDYRAVTAYHSGDLLNRLTSDVQVITSGITSLLPTVAGMLTKMVSAFWVLCLLDLRFSLLFAVAGLGMFTVTRFFRKRLKALHKRVQETDGQVRALLQEILENFLVIRSFGAEKKMSERSQGLQQANYREKIKKNTISVTANTGISFIFNLGYLYALIWSCQGIIAGSITIGTLTAVLQLINQIQAPFVGLSGILPQYYGVMASAERMMEIEELKAERILNGEPLDPGVLYQELKGIHFNSISFSYGREPVFDDARFFMEKGDCIMIAGASGIGKSTLLKLLMGVLTPNKGRIVLKMKSGFPITVDRCVRSLFAYVPQGNFLLSGTIRENVLFMCPEAEKEVIEEALRLSCAQDFINKLPDGLETRIGEKGLGLSEGQVQRLAIARAILGGAPILLFDEATSALDAQTERRVLENIKGLEHKTCIIVTHREAARKVCNKIIKITHGKIEEEVKHSVL